MNLQEEIVKALKTAADHVDASSYHYADFGMVFESSQNQELSFVLSQLATSVENARCETCEGCGRIAGKSPAKNTRATNPLLKEMAEALAKLLRVHDRIIDYGGDALSTMEGISGRIEAREVIKKYREQVDNPRNAE